MPDLSSLIADIYNVLDNENDHVASEDNLEALGRNISELVKERLRKRSEKPTLRVSNLGKPDRALWYSINRPDLAEPLPKKAQLKFLYGDIIEQVLIFLAKEAGHEVTHEQHEVEISGIKGHLDCVIDGVTVDCKSAAPFSFKKFSQGTLFSDDPFGYVTQVSGYASEVTPETGGAFLAADKVDGSLALLSVDPDTVRENETEKRVHHLKEVTASDKIPPRCYAPIPEGKSGNMRLGTNCSYCPFKFECWSDANGGEGLKTYYYSGGPKYLTHVQVEPRVKEF